MDNRLLLMISCWMMFLVCACVYPKQYKVLENKAKASEIQKNRADQKINRLEADLERADDKIKSLEAEQQRSEELGKKYLQELADLQAKLTYLENINQQLSQNNEKLQHDLQKKNSVILMQEKVIQLLDDTKKTIQSSLKDQVAAKDIELIETQEQLKMVLVDRILFESGSIDISAKGRALLFVIANSIKDYKNQNVVVAGHTDDKPISAELSKRYPSNWELSAARSAVVVRFLQYQGGLAPERLSVCGYSFYRPIAPNKTEKDRRQNRRIEIILSPQE